MATIYTYPAAVARSISQRRSRDGGCTTAYSQLSQVFLLPDKTKATSKSRDEVHFGEWAETHSGEQFLMAEDGEGSNKLIIFSTTRLGNIQNLAEADKVFMDRTFQTCPGLFYQIFTIHAFKNGPTVFSLENCF